MLISRKKKFIFYHVYKVAGSSMREALRPYCSTHQILLQNIDFICDVVGVNSHFSPTYKFHPRLSAVKAHMGDEFDEFYKFAFVRHPLDWQKSLYFFMKINKKHTQHTLVKDMTFEEYLRWRIDHDFHLMSEFVTDADGTLLLDDVFKFEHIDSEFEKLCQKINISAKLPHKNIAGKGKSVELSDVLYQEFKDAFAIDFEMFNYE